jgi:pyruvate,orthophosphate dikinase
MNSAQGILTSRGGMTSHAAVVARGMGKPCIVGCEEMEVDEENKQFKANGVVVKEGEWISIDGSTGEVMLGQLKTVVPEGLVGYVGKILEWADKFRKLGVRANADIPRDAEAARRFGAEGIGLCRTEHMFFEADRIPIVRRMIVAKTKEQRQEALDKLLPMQKEDFKGLFRIMKGLPVTIRLLDPPLHEFLPHEEEAIEQLAKDMGISVEELKETVESLKEFNPMLGHRGCRLAITYPEIAVMQTEAIILAAIELKKEEGIEVIPEIMLPLVGHINEMKYLKNIIVETVEKLMKEHGVELKYLVGTMIEVPRAALTADQIAEEAEFFSFGTNDLTQMTFGFSRDDAGKFLKDYLDKNILPDDPFKKLDREGVGQLLKIAKEKALPVRPDIKLGICGEHGGEPSSIEFCHMVGLNYVSCSPFRVPVARLAAAQAAIKHG